MAELVSIKRNVDVSPGQAAPAVFHCSQGDVGSKIILGLLNNGTAYAIPSGVTVTIEGSESNGSIFTPISATASGSDISFYLTGEMTAVAGPAICQAVLKSGSNILGTANFTLEVESSPMGADAPPVFTDAGWTWTLNKLNTEFVPALGDNIIDAIEGKLDKNQGTTNAGKYLKVGADGNVETADLDVTTDKTLSITDKAADAKAVGDEITSLKADLSNDLTTLEYTANGNLYNVSNIIRNKYIDPSTGKITNIQHAEFGYSPTYIPVSSGETIISNNRMFIAYYDRYYNILSALQMDATKKTVVPEEAVYARFSVSSVDHSTVIVQRGQYLNGEKNNYIFNLAGLDVDPMMTGAKQNTSLMNFRLGKNLYNSYNVIHNKYIDPTSGIITNISYRDFGYSPTYIPVSPGETIISNNRMFIAYYDRYYNVLSALQMDITKKTIVPEGAVYARFSVSSADHSAVSVQVGTTLDDNAGQYCFYLDGLTSSDTDITVDAGGSGDYVSLTQAVYENVDNGKTINVMPGEYDVKSEYVALFGQTVVDDLSDATSGINNFQYGIRIRNRKIVFNPGAKVLCDWTGKTIDATHRFCAFRVEDGAEIEGLYLVCTATFYGIHDDYGPTTPFTIKYKNCHIDCYDLYNANCIGGGCHKYSRHVIENCYFNNHVTSADKVLSADVRYHNTNTADAEPEIYISNCYFSNNFNAAYYGNQTTKMKVYVNNCHAPKGINKVRESSSMNVDNVDLYKWNNEES